MRDVTMTGYIKDSQGVLFSDTMKAVHAGSRLKKNSKYYQNFGSTQRK